MKKIKILQIISSSEVGGGEKVFLSLIKYLDRDKFDIFIACPADGPMFEDFKKYAHDIKVFNFKNWLNPATIISLKKYMQKERFDIVHTHLYSADFMGIIAATLAGIPGRVSTIYGHNFSKTGRFDLRTIRNFFFSFIYRGIYFFNKEIIAIAQAIKQDLINRPGIRVNEDKIKIIYCGIDPEQIVKNAGIIDESIDSIVSDNGYKHVGVIANFDRVKGHYLLLKAIPEILSRIKNVKFLFAGDGAERKRLEEMAKRSKLEKDIVFMGSCRNVPRLMSACDLIVLPSLIEGTPLVVLESAILAKPIVATRVGGIPELVKENENAILVPPQNHKALSDAIVKVLEDEKLCLAMRQKSSDMLREGFYERFEAKYMTEEIEKFYKRCLV